MSVDTTDRIFSNCERDEDKRVTEPIVQIVSTSMQKGETTVAKRLEIIQKLEEGVPVEKLCMEYGLHRRTIQRYRKNVEVIRKISQHPRSLSMKRHRVSLHEDTNIRLHHWVLERQAEGIPFTDSLLQEKARELHKKFGGTTHFTASRGWLWRFKKRFIKDASWVEEEKSPAYDLCAEKLAKILNDDKIELENVYNVHEKSFMWRDLPETVLLRGGETINIERIKKDYVTVAFCSNATGTHKLPPLFIYKYANPRALKHCRHLLPVVYISQNNGCLDEIVFNDWYANHFKPSVRQHQHQRQRVAKVLLIVDHFKSDMLFEKEHEDLDFKLMTLPSDIHTTIQPLEEHVIKKCKKLFRQKLVCRVHQFDGGIKDFYADYDVKDCIDLISEAWDEIRLVDIKYSWRKFLGHEHTVIISEELVNLEAGILTEEITKWISQYEDEEEESIIEENSNSANTNCHCSLEEPEIDRMFHILEIWAKNKPDFIKSHVKSLIEYYNQSCSTE